MGHAGGSGPRRARVVIAVDGDGVPVGIDSFASEIVGITKLEAEGRIFGLVCAEGPERKAG